MKWRIVLLVVMSSVGACTLRLTDYRAYHGDGTFTAHAAPSALCRDGYSVDLGSVELTAPAELTRQLEGLPRMTATIGLAIRKQAQEGIVPQVARAHRPTTAVVDISLLDEGGRSVFARQEALSTWAGSAQLAAIEHAYLYRRGPTWEVPQPSGAVRVEPIGVGADDGWAHISRHDAKDATHYTSPSWSPTPNLPASKRICWWKA